ncbi:MAG: beta-lactamase family protein [Verrucomicrobia bacterium]|nr:beta-lactamase family protein [Verrucomicrobiota bacterium]
MKPPRLLPVCSLLLFVALASLRAAEADPASLGFDPARLGRLDALIQAQVDQQKIGGVVLYVARDGKPVRDRGYGMQDLESGKAMPADAIFRIASMSKAVTSVAVMMLYEEGKFLLHDNVSKYIPEFAKSVVAVPRTAETPEGRKYATVPAKRPIQIRDLLTHCAGLTYGDGLAVDDYKAANVYMWYFANKDEPVGDVIKRLAKLPLHGQPGEQYQYGFSTDVLGYLVEVVSGMPLDRFFAERIFGPLKMVDSCFFLAPEKAARLAPVYGIEGGKLVKTDQGDYVTGPRKCFSGGAGLLSTAGDYGRLLQMLLDGGQLDGVRLLSPKSVELMRSNHTGTKYAGDTGAFGLGFWVMQDVGFYGELGTPGAFGWGSAYFPQYLVDPKERIVALLMTQLRPTGGNTLNQQFKVLMYQALVK